MIANTTNVSHGAPCCPALPFLPNDGVDVFVTESERERTLIREKLTCHFNFRLTVDPVSLKLTNKVNCCLLRRASSPPPTVAVCVFITSPGGRRIRHTPCSTRRGGFDVAQSTRRHVDSTGVIGKDVGRLGGGVLCPSAAVPRPPIGLSAGLRGQMLGDVLCRVRCGRSRS